MPVCIHCGAFPQDGSRYCSGCGSLLAGSDPHKDPLVGRTIARAYVVSELVGVGGMGRVYKAEHKMLARTVAIKVIHPHLLSDEQTVARFYTEARAASRLNHPNSVSIIDFGRTDDEMLYLVMEFLRGRDLAQVMVDDGPLPFERIIQVINAVLAALGEAHALDVIHRDLKPENIFLERTRTGRDLVKVLDFGLAKILSAPQEARSITSPGLVCGTPDYMSPEQGRGEDVDGRGDIYSVGVLLFELMTDRLPFIADTPTKIVLKHIQEPVPDPTEVAPHRAIPRNLADITMRAMAKSADERFQSPDEMIEALRRTAGSIAPPSKDEVVCYSCGARSPKGKSFCGECGASMREERVSPTVTPTARRSRPPHVSSPRLRPLVGREGELGRLDALREQAMGEMVSVTLVGEPGTGKTRLISEAVSRATRAGDLAFGAGPHDSGAPVPYWPIRELLAQLHDTDEEGLKRLSEQGEGELELLAAAGIRQVLAPTGLVGAGEESSSSSVACALAAAIRSALREKNAGRILVYVDDLDRCDGLTPRVLRQLRRYVQGTSVFLLTAINRSRPSLIPDGTISLAVKGLKYGHALSFSSGAAPLAASELEGEEQLYLPLYVEQLLGLGLSVDGSEPLPPRLADAVTQRLQRLDLSARLLLQSASVLGNRCPKNLLEEVAGKEKINALDALTERRLLLVDNGQVEMTHPFIRDLVEAFIPAQARKELHARALELLSAKPEETPLEVRAYHAYHSGEVFNALMMLEMMGNLAATRGDTETSVFSYQRGLELARRELLETGDTTLDTAIATFSRKLGSALASRGDVTGADGVLREALELTEPVSLERVRMLVVLGEVVAARKRYRDAYRLLGQALDIAMRLESDTAQAEVHLGIASVRREELDFLGAAAALWEASELMARSGADTAARAFVAVDLASLLVEDGDLEGARSQLDEAEARAHESGQPHLEAKVVGMLAKIDDVEGNRDLAKERYAEAIRLAARAGDAVAVDTYQSAMGTATEMGATGRPRSGRSDA